ncbi:MAG: menaquinone biosynthesis protein [Chthoniobacteraceae bacterium]
MKTLGALQGLRIGCVKYLNSRPLIHSGVRNGEVPVIFEHPAQLADDLRAGQLDAALIPVFEAMRIPGLVAADGVGIACRGPVYSVLLAYRGELQSHRVVSLDPASRTSVHLAQVLLAEYYRMQPTYIKGGEADARVLIGTQAIDFRQQHGGTWNYLDFGEAWLQHTGLPFVFALWMLRADLPGVGAIAEAFRILKAEGTAALPEIVATEENPEFARQYLTEYIRFDVGSEEKQALELFRKLLIKHGLLPDGGQPLHYV